MAKERTFIVGGLFFTVTMGTGVVCVSGSPASDLSFGVDGPGGVLLGHATACPSVRKLSGPKQVESTR